MGVSKVDYYGETLIDLTEDTVSEETVMEGVTFTNGAGEKKVGTFIPFSGNYDDLINKPSIPSSVVQIDNEFAISLSSENVSEATEWVSRTSPLTQRQRACVYGGGYYIVCGTSGDFAYSEDGVNFTKLEKFTSDVITGICYGKGTFVAIDSGGKLWVSTNPTDWVDTGNTFNTIIEAIAYANNRFVAVCDGGIVLLSDNGTEWQTVDTGTGKNLYGVCAGNGMFVAVGQGGTILTSVDGNTWTDRTNASVTGDLRCVGYGNGLFVAGGQGGVIESSSDTVTWTVGSSNTTLTINYIRAIVYAYGKFYAVMYASNGSGEIWVSSDSITWSVQYSASGRLWCAFASDDIVIVSGDNGAIYALDLGVEWTNKKPEVGESEYLWQRNVIILSDGGKVTSEAYCVGGSGKDGKDGEDGYTPQKGVDYFTKEDVEEIVAAVLAALPTWNGGSY